ncbi:MAG: hypothetical protein JW804_00995 [Sedimentisphaerales bacterium]|nr:hypothetical protein [Sedimentisphaerales bacterium]
MNIVQQLVVQLGLTQTGGGRIIWIENTLKNSACHFEPRCISGLRNLRFLRFAPMCIGASVEMTRIQKAAQAFIFGIKQNGKEKLGKTPKRQTR